MTREQIQDYINSILQSPGAPKTREELTITMRSFCLNAGETEEITNRILDDIFGYRLPESLL